MEVEGQLIGSYRIIRPLGTGGMGRVYEAEHVELKVRRALKYFATGSEHAELLRKRFVAEGRILADLQHPRLVRVYDFAIDESTGAPYFAMDLVLSPSGEPQTLQDACKSGVDEEQVAGWFRDICEGLGYIHAKGVVHRDISLDNILIGPDGHAVLGDFGIAKIIGEEYRRKLDLTVTMLLAGGERFSWGKGLYMSPEMTAGGEATPASDAYAVGVLLFRLLAGSWYTPDTRLDDALAGMDYNWAEVIARLCAKDTSVRLPAGGMSEAAALLHSTVRPPRYARWPWLALSSIVLAAAAALAIAMAIRKEAKPVVPTPEPKKVTSEIYHIVDVPLTNYVTEKVYQIIPVTNSVVR